ncbi:MAG: hypothetical protein EZS28_030449, partial [Streblomastix strix]
RTAIAYPPVKDCWYLMSSRILDIIIDSAPTDLSTQRDGISW